jgi:hypothetical protein
MPAPSILADHPAMGPVPCIAARPRRLPPRPPPGLPPATRGRSDHLRQARPGAGVRLWLPQDRRPSLLGDHHPRPPRPVDHRGIFATLELLVLQAYDQMIGLEFGDLAVDGCITKAPCGGDVAGRSPVDRGKQGRKRFTVTEARGIPLRTVAAAANRNESPLLGPTLDTMARLGSLPQQPTVHLDRGYDSGKTRAELAEHGMTGQIAERGKPAPVHASQRWRVERTHAWGQPVQEAGLEYRTPRPGHRRVLGICPRDHRATPADPLCLDPVPLGHPTLTTPLSHHPRRC